MSAGYRAGWRWLPMGALLGAVAGAAVGAASTAVLVLVDSATEYGPADLVASIVVLGGLGAFVGAVLGSIAGLVVAVPLVVLVGRHLPVRVARRRAFVLGVLLPPVVLVAMLSALSRDPSMLVDVIRRPLDGYLLLTSSALGGPLAAWAAGKDVRAPQPDVS